MKEQHIDGTENLPESVEQPNCDTHDTQRQLTIEGPTSKPAVAETKDTSPVEGEQVKDSETPVARPELSEDSLMKRTTSGRVIKEPSKFRDYVRL